MINIISDEAELEFAIDGGTYRTIGVFNQLVSGTYLINVRNVNGCIRSKSVFVGGPDQCMEICDNGIDDDGDGFVDCDDPDCQNADEIITEQTAATCPNNNNGIIEITNSSQTFEYSIDGTNFSSTSKFENLTTQNYMITSRNTSGCTNVVFVEVPGGGSCVEICNNDIDDDDDGLTDCEDPDCGISVLIEETISATTCPGNNNGSIQITSASEGLEYALDDGAFSNAILFENLEPGNYIITARNNSGCLASKMMVVPGVASCVEICDNGIDDDGDGLIDCDDPDCKIDDDFTFVITGECEGALNGAITVVPSSNAAYRFSLSGSAFETNSTFGGLGIGVI